eukprot:12927269-Prorocentrum_lima.AAC.1
MSRDCTRPRTSEGIKPKNSSQLAHNKSPEDRTSEEQEQTPAKLNQTKGTPKGAKGTGGGRGR